MAECQDGAFRAERSQMKALPMKQYGGRNVLDVNHNAPKPVAQPVCFTTIWPVLVYQVACTNPSGQK